MAYDEARGVSVLFGGVNATSEFNDTWLWDGNDWVQVFPQHVPMARWLHSLAYDSQRQVVVMYGGSMLAAQPYTWEWDGADWIDRQDILEPDRWRWGTAMTYDPRRGETVIFGGQTTNIVFFGDTWKRPGGGDWIEVITAKSPIHRTQAYFAYFPRLRSSVLYGGSESPNVFINDTWLWTGKRWFKYPVAQHPTGNCGAMVYDPVLHGLLAWMGCSAPGVLDNETWLLH